MEIVFSIQFITGIIFVFIGIFLLYLVKQGKTKLIVQGIERLTIGNFEGYLTILFGFTAMAISTIRNLIPDLPSWGTIPITIGLLLIVIIVRNKIKR